MPEISTGHHNNLNLGTVIAVCSLCPPRRGLFFARWDYSYCLHLVMIVKNHLPIWLLCMWDTIKEIYLSVNKTSGDRIKSPFYGVYVFTWLAFNWESVAIFIFSDMKMENRVSFINSAYPFSFIIPLIISVLLTIFLPFINEWFSKVQSKPLSKTSLIMSQRKRKALLADISVERVRARRDVTYDRHRVGAEKEVQVMREAIASSAERTGKLTEELDLAHNTIFNLEIEIKNLSNNCNLLKEALEKERITNSVNFDNLDYNSKVKFDTKEIIDINNLKNKKVFELEQAIARIEKDIGHFHKSTKNQP